MRCSDHFASPFPSIPTLVRTLRNTDLVNPEGRLRRETGAEEYPEYRTKKTAGHTGAGRNPITPGPSGTQQGRRRASLGGVAWGPVCTATPTIPSSPRRSSQPLRSEPGSVPVHRVCSAIAIWWRWSLSSGLALFPTPPPTRLTPSLGSWSHRGQCRFPRSPLPQPKLATERYYEDGRTQGERDVFQRLGNTGDLLQAAIVAETHE